MKHFLLPLLFLANSLIAYSAESSQNRQNLPVPCEIVCKDTKTLDLGQYLEDTLSEHFSYRSSATGIPIANSKSYFYLAALSSTPEELEQIELNFPSEIYRSTDNLTPFSGQGRLRLSVEKETAWLPIIQDYIVHVSQLEAQVDPRNRESQSCDILYYAIKDGAVTKSVLETIRDESPYQVMTILAPATLVRPDGTVSSRGQVQIITDIVPRANILSLAKANAQNRLSELKNIGVCK